MPPITRLVIATHNAGKLHEMSELLAPYGIDTISAAALNLPEPEETGDTFVANAVLKAEAAVQASGLPALADDSGLCVDALDGAPGLYSARFAAGDFASAMSRLTAMLDERKTPVEARRGHFVAALALVWPDRSKETVEGKVFGHLVQPRGTLGFGYDPMFLPDGHSRTFGEMSADEKHGIPADGSQALSHRARAFQMLARRCFG